MSICEEEEEEEKDQEEEDEEEDGEEENSHECVSLLPSMHASVQFLRLHTGASATGTKILPDAGKVTLIKLTFP